MKEQLVSFETAVLAKEKGFDEHCNHYMEDTKEPYTNTDGSVYNNKDLDCPYFKEGVGAVCAAPTQSLLQKWLWEKHNLYVCVVMYCLDPYSLNKDNSKIEFHSQVCKNKKILTSIGVYECPFECLKEILKIALNKLQ